jgi:hypothetical protein
MQEPTLFDAVRPYTGSSGWSGSETSKRRADDADTSGKTARLQQDILAELGRRRADGLTVKEAREVLSGHHGAVSGALSNLHKAHVIARLSENRQRCAVYVLPSHVQERPTEKYTPNKAQRELVQLCDDLHDMLMLGRTDQALQRITEVRRSLSG